MNIETSIEEALTILEKQYNIDFSKQKYSKSQLVTAVVSDNGYALLGYTTSQGFNRYLRKLFPGLQKDSYSWKNYLLKLNNTYLCSTCNKVKNIEEKTKDRNKCKSCDNKRSKERRKAGRKFIYDFLSKSCCKDCGIQNPIVLEFDHKKDKKYNISNMTSYSIELIKKEIEKCDVVCANCHRIRTSKQQNWYNF